MDKLDRLIADYEGKIAEVDEQLRMLREERDRASIALAAYREAAEIRPSSSSGAPEGVQGAALGGDMEVRSRGRQPGSIANDWRFLMRNLVAAGRPWLTYAGMHVRCEKAGINIRAASIRGRVRHYTEMGFFEEMDGRFRVTDAAIQRFQLDAPVIRSEGAAPVDVVSNAGEASVGEKEGSIETGSASSPDAVGATGLRV